MSFQESNSGKSWQNKTWVQLLAIAIAILPYLIAFFFPTYSYTVNIKVTLTHILIWSLIVFVILLLQRYLVGERFRDLNFKPGTWWKDILSGIALAALTLAILFLTSSPISSLFPAQKELHLGFAYREVFQSPWLFALWLGPGILISSGIGEELLRTFVLTRLWKISSLPAWKLLTVFLYAGLFGLGHIYLGPDGVIQAAIYGCVIGFYYLRFGRVTVMIIAHYLHFAFQFVLMYIWANP
ncbi:MAG: CPBP family intramembrane glutamic endopeptidase [Anaerolineales bacterium]